jgi:dihydroorotate dehydrogenase
VYALVRPLLFALDPATAHALGMATLAPLEHVGPLRALARAMFAEPRERLVTKAMGLTFPSPIGLAAGFDKNAERARALAALGFGHVELGTVTAIGQEANPAPNLFRLPADRALVNRLGFPNDGAATVTHRLAARGGARAVGVPVGISIGKSRAVGIDPLAPAVADYIASFRAAREEADFVVANVSSPNTKDLRALQSAELARELLSELVRENASGRRVALLVKVAPDLGDAELDALLDVANDLGLAGVVATNTTIGRSGLVTAAARVEAVGAGGLSGPPLRARALEVVGMARAKLGRDATVIGVGGIETVDDVLAFVRAGANLVQLYTGFVYGGPLIAYRLARELDARLAGMGVRRLAELVGDAGGGVGERPQSEEPKRWTDT